jgi:hypothetical protein
MIYQEALLTERGSKPRDLVFSLLDDDCWTEANLIAGLRRWIESMTEDVFNQGSIVDKSVYVYCMYMVIGHGCIDNHGWAVKGLHNVIGWLDRLL